MTDPPPSPYATLSIPPTASLAVIKAAFRTAARRTHPDRQHKERGSEGHAPPPPPPSPSFAAARAAYETLADPARRAAWDACAAVAPGGVAPPPASAARATAARRAARAAGGGEDALLAGWAPPGPVSAPSSALVITCEACRRPATAACWVCGMDLCAYCTRTPHWKGSTALHWPLINTPHALVGRLARRELEAKRAEDAAAEEEASPGWVRPAERAGAAEFAAAAAAAVASFPDPATRAATHIHALARYYLWDQTEGAVVVAVHVPGGGGGGREGGANIKNRVEVACSSGCLSVRRDGCPAVVSRRLAHPVCGAARPAVAVTKDGRTVVVVLAKAATGGRPWRCLFEGDTDGARAAAPPYRVEVEGGGGRGGGGGGAVPPRPPLPSTSCVMVELPLPWWVTKEDVSAVDCTARELRVVVAGGAAARITRRFRAGAAISPGEATWSLVEEAGADPSHPAGHRRPGKLLVVALGRAPPPPTAEEAPACKKEEGALCFFACDEDAFSLGAPLAGGVVAAGGVGTVRGEGMSLAPVRTRGELPPGGGVGVFDALSSSGALGAATTPGRAGAGGPAAMAASDDGGSEDEGAWEF